MAWVWQYIGTGLPLNRKSLYVKMVMLKAVTKTESGRRTDAERRLFSCPAVTEPAPGFRALAFVFTQNTKEEFV